MWAGMKFAQLKGLSKSTWNKKEMTLFGKQPCLRARLVFSMLGLILLGCVASREGAPLLVGKTYTWEDGLRQLIFQTVYPLAKETIRISVGEFKDATTDGKTTVSDSLESDLKVLLADDDGIISGSGLPVETTPVEYLLSGVYVLAGDTLRINTTLQSSTRQIVSTGSILIYPKPLDSKGMPKVEPGHPRKILPPIEPKPPEQPIDIIGVPGVQSPKINSDQR